MALALRSAATVLALAFAAGATLPCPPSVELAPGTSFASPASEPGDAEAVFGAPCPCGCRHDATPTAPGGRLGPSLPASVASSAPVLEGALDGRLPALGPPPAPALGIDPIPI
ncbi:MAG: hypothetical protein QNK03_20560 [Myxococcota bacterium]|nr:hypothetical protein [Myxococcota bacterium]